MVHICTFPCLFLNEWSTNVVYIVQTCDKADNGLKNNCIKKLLTTNEQFN